MRILGIETSCDETSAAVVEDGTRVRSNIIASTSCAFAQSGGVIPEVAAREQVRCILPVIAQALEGALVTSDELDAIAVTKGPGLLVSLLVGTMTARTLSRVWGLPLVGVHHHLGHLSSTWLETGNQEPGLGNPTEFPILALTASGGHTELWLRTAHTTGTLLGQTRDDAAGEAFDKGAALLGLPYPGGPAIAAAAASGNPRAHRFPLPLRRADTFDFSFSGLKTALKYLLRDAQSSVITHQLPDIAASYQHAICAHLTDRLARGVSAHPEVREVHVVGGVAANAYLRAMLCRCLPGRRLQFPATIAYCTDNAAMIAAAAACLIAERGNLAFAPFETSASLPLHYL